mgnify:CR=1 FL=1
MDGDEDNDASGRSMEIEYHLFRNGLYFTETNTWAASESLARKMTYGQADSLRRSRFSDAAIMPIVINR